MWTTLSSLLCLRVNTIITKLGDEFVLRDMGPLSYFLGIHVSDLGGARDIRVSVAISGNNARESGSTKSKADGFTNGGENSISDE